MQFKLDGLGLELELGIIEGLELVLKLFFTGLDPTLAIP